MAIPKTLYHGTSGYRAEFIMVAGLRTKMPKGLEYVENELDNKQYCYLTDDVNEAAGYAVQQAIVDERTPKAMKMKQLKQWRAVGGIIAIRTSHIRHNIEIDPEQVNFETRMREAFGDTLFERFKRDHGRWYRHKGDIPRKFLTYYQVVPLGDNSDKAIELETIIELQIKNKILHIPDGFDLP